MKMKRDNFKSTFNKNLFDFPLRHSEAKLISGVFQGFLREEMAILPGRDLFGLEKIGLIQL